MIRDDVGKFGELNELTNRRSERLQEGFKNYIANVMVDLVMSPRLVRCRSIVPAIYREQIKCNYSWGTFLGNLLRLLNRSGGVRSRCPDFVVSVESFHKAPLIEYMKCVNEDMKFEVALLGDYGCKSQPLKLYWFARVVKVVGYRLLLRYEGMDQDGDSTYDFWVNISSQDIKPIGYCARNVATRALVPPQVIYDRRSNWRQYIFDQIPFCKTLCISWPEILVRELKSSKFKKGDEVELLDSIYRLRVRPAFVKQIIGSRIWVAVSEKFMIGPTIIKGDPQLGDGIWMDQNSPIIFPIGWSRRLGYMLEANRDYFKHLEEISATLQPQSSGESREKRDVSPSISQITSEGVEVKWQKGMKLEVLDPFGAWNELRVSTVAAVMNDGFLKITFDGEMDHYAVPLHFTSELLFPVGYGAKYDLALKKPKNVTTPGNFDWDAYLRETNAVAAPEELFHAFKDDVLCNFKIGAKLEAVDMCEPQLICPAAVSSHHGRLLKISYDGWDSSYNQLFDYRSPNIFPLGWCEMNGYRLTTPAMSKKRKRS
ncbi:unnamed protein product [Litomosoides sigmodontis]|uniref:SLED domain-containing protein n=1 Tax=Litomosoides sigmodontis TaxID=42156 RepID=A0A3P6UN64_LITSI|nr:unnamed protein product [Litomosoides sigmodontis]